MVFVCICKRYNHPTPTYYRQVGLRVVGIAQDWLPWACWSGEFGRVPLGISLVTSWWFQLIWKILVKMRIFPNWGENKQYLKPHLVQYWKTEWCVASNELYGSWVCWVWCVWCVFFHPGWRIWDVWKSRCSCTIGVLKNFLCPKNHWNLRVFRRVLGSPDHQFWDPMILRVTW